MVRGGASIKVLLPAALLAGCAISPTSDLATFAQRSGSNSFEVLNRKLEAPDALVLALAHDRQTRGPACGAHALASVINYWRGPGTIRGDMLFTQTPPAAEAGYSMAELMEVAADNGLLASAVRLPEDAIVAELESGRPVLTPVRVPSIYVQQRSLPGGNVPVVGLARNTLIYRAGKVSEWTRLAMVDHYLLVVGHDADHFVVVEPVMGYRTIGREKLARYRRAFGDAAIVFSGNAPPQMASR